MAHRESCERRVYRLATLLTGNPRQAVSVIASVLDAQPNLTKLDSPHLDRLTVLRSREVKAASLDVPGVPPEMRDALYRMKRQQREAWVLHYVYRMMPRDIARAMDCSVRAVQVHLTGAENSMECIAPNASRVLGKALLDYSLTLDVPDVYRRVRVTRRARRWLKRLLIVLLVLVVIAGGLVVVDRLALLDQLVGLQSHSQTSGGISDKPEDSR